MFDPILRTIMNVIIIAKNKKIIKCLLHSNMYTLSAVILLVALSMQQNHVELKKILIILIIIYLCACSRCMIFA